MARKHRADSAETLRLYRDLAEWYPLLTPVGDYAEEAAFYQRLFETHCRRPPRTLLDLGSGGGHNAAHLSSAFACTLVDLSVAMLTVSRRLNPQCEHIQGDMRSIRLGRVFDCVLVHDAVGYMTSHGDLAGAIGTAFEHTAPGGVARFQPVSCGDLPARHGHRRYDAAEPACAISNAWDPDPPGQHLVADMVYLLRDTAGTLRLHEGIPWGCSRGPTGWRLSPPRGSGPV
jgi:SAM-dependent methyltransferase